MDKYKKLTMNTLILMIGTMGSRIITFFMLPFYTNILSTTEYGTIDLMLQITNFMIPICTIGITSGIVRFGLDDQYDKKDVLSTALICFGGGFLLCVLISVVARYLPFADGIGQYLTWVLILIGVASLNSICGNFVRAEEKVRIFAITGILNTVCNVLLMIIFLKIMHLGIRGYMMAVIFSDIVAVLFLTFTCKLWKYIRFTSLNRLTTKEMIRFSVPIIPATISWWIIDMSDRFMIWLFIGASANGIYSVATKIPSIVTILASVFINAWQISIIGTKGKLEQSQFYSNIMRSYQALLFVMAGFVTLFSRLIITILTSSDFYEAWQYVPFLINATVFSCLATFVGNIYTIEKKSVSQLITTMAGALSNILLNWILIPRIGILGAAIATFFSFTLVFIIRMIDTRQYIQIHWSPLRFCISLALLMIQSLVMIMQWGPVYLIQAICLIGLILVNFKALLTSIEKILRIKPQTPTS